MKNALAAVVAALGGVAIFVYIALAAGLLVGWLMNIYKLIAHSPELAQWGVEQVIRIVGLIPIVGGIVGWF